MAKYGMAFGMLLLRSVIAAQTEECDDSAYLQSQRSQPLTPAAPSYAFMEVGTAGLTEPGPDQLTCGDGDMYHFGGPPNGANSNTCLTVNPETPDATTCTFSQFENQEFQGTCWWPLQASTDYCQDVFDPSSSTQVTLEGTNVTASGPQEGKTACFTAMPPQFCPKYAMPPQFCPKYVCVVSLLQDGTEERSCYNTAGKTCAVEVDTGVDTIKCTEWSPTDSTQFCLSSLARDGGTETGTIAPINSFAVQWECCQSGGSSGDPHVRTMDGKHYTLLQEGTFKLWSLSNLTTEYGSSAPHDPLAPKMKTAQVDWEIFVHYSTGRSYAKGLLLVDKTLETHQYLELTSESCRWRSRSGTGEWSRVERPMPLFTPSGADFVTGFNLTRTGRKNGQMDVRFLMNTRYGIKRIASLKISCQPGHHINTKLRLDKMQYKKAVAGQISAGRNGIRTRSNSSNISQMFTEMRRMSSLQMMQDQEFFVQDKWIDVGGSHGAAAYLKEVDDKKMGFNSFVETCGEKEEHEAKMMCAHYMGADIVNATGYRRDAFTDCVFDVCAGGGEAAAELAAEIMTEGDY